MSSRNSFLYNADRVPSPHSFGGYQNMKRTLKPADEPSTSFFSTEFDQRVVGPGDGYGGPGESDMHGGVGVNVGDPSRGMPSYHAPMQHVQDPNQLHLSHHQHGMSHHHQQPHPHSLPHQQHHPQQQQHHQPPPPQQSQHQQQQQHQQQLQPQQQQQQTSQIQQQPLPQPLPPTLSQQPQQQQAPPPPQTPGNTKKRQRPTPKTTPATPAVSSAPAVAGSSTPGQQPSTTGPSPAKRSRTNTAWTQAEEQLLKQMRDAGTSWSDIAKSFPSRTEGSVKKHWYKDMHWAEFGEEEVPFPPHANRPSSRHPQYTTKEADMNVSSSQSALLLAAIKEYDANKWKAIGAKVNKPAKACEAYAKEHFGNKI